MVVAMPTDDYDHYRMIVSAIPTADRCIVDDCLLWQFRPIVMISTEWRFGPYRLMADAMPIAGFGQCRLMLGAMGHCRLMVGATSTDDLINFY